jgi:hypothetical protein
MAEPLIIAAFDDRNEASLAVDELQQAGFEEKDYGFAIRGSDAVRGGMMTDAVGAKDAEGAVKGATVGTALGGVLGAVAAATIPGVGPVLAGGILMTALGYAGAGAAIGGIFGAMHGLGTSEEEAVELQKMFESGKAIVAVRPKDKPEVALDIINRHGGYDARVRH